MSKTREVLRLKYLNQLSNRQIQTMTGVSRSSVSNYLKVYETLAIPIEKLLEFSDSKMKLLDPRVRGIFIAPSLIVPHEVLCTSHPYLGFEYTFLSHPH